MKGFVERTKARMGDLQSQVTTGVTRMRSHLGRSLDDLGSDLGTPVSSELMALEGAQPEELVAKLEAQNQVLWAKAKTALALEEENAQLQAELQAVTNKLTVEIRDAKDQIKAEREASGALKEKLRTMATESKDEPSGKSEKADLRARMEELQVQVVLSKDALATESLAKAAQEEIVSSLQSTNQSLLVELNDKELIEDRLSKEVIDLRSKLQEALNKASLKDNIESNAEAETRSDPDAHEASHDIELVSRLNDMGRELREAVSRSSELQQLSDGLTFQVKSLEAEQFRLCARNTMLEEQLCNCQRNLTESEESRSYLTSIVEDLQKQVDTCSPEQVIGLRGMVQNLERDNNLLQADVEILSLQLRGASNLPSQVESNPPVPDVSYGDSVESRDNYEEDGGTISRGPTSEPLVDVSHDIVAEMANLASHSNVPLFLSSVQYAGLLSTVQIAVQKLQDTKGISRSQSDTFALLDQMLSKSLSITKPRDRHSYTELHDRLGTIGCLLVDRQSEIAFLQEIFEKLKQQTRDQWTLSLPQEVQSEYLLLRLSSQEKIIKLSWEVEGLRKDLEEASRKLEVMQEQSEQQQRELKIQWESKQQALAETQVQHSQVSSVSQQVDQLQQINENLQSERVHLERDLEEAREEVTSLQAEVERWRGHSIAEIEESGNGLLPSHVPNVKPENFSMYSDTEDLLRAADEQMHMCEEWLNYFSSNVDDAKLTALNISKEALGVVDQLKSWHIEKEELLNEIESLHADLELGNSVKLKLEASIKNLQGEVNVAENRARMLEDKHQSELQMLQKELHSAGISANSEIMVLQDIQSSLQGSLQRTRDHAQELTVRLEESDKEKHSIANALNTAMLDRQKAEQKAHAVVCDLEQERDCLSADLAAWKFKASELGDAADEKDTLLKENEQLVEQLSLKEAMWESERRKFNELTVEISKKHKELSNMELVVSRLEDNLTSSREEVARLNDNICSERQQYTAAARLWEEELEALPGLTVPRDSWPSPVRRLVEHCEQAAEAHARDSEAAAQQQLEKKAEDAMSRTQEMKLQYEQRIGTLETDRATALRKLSQLEGEMKERERIVQEKLSSFEVMAEKNQILESEMRALTQAAFELSVANDGHKVTISHVTCELEDKCNELTMVQDKARKMMIEKDNRIIELSNELRRTRPPVQEANLMQVGGQSVTETPSAGSEQSTSHAELTTRSMSMSEPGNTADNYKIHQLPGITGKSHVVELQEAQDQVRKLEMEMQESDRTHALRDKANSVLKEEIAELQRELNRESLDVTYLKNVLVTAFEQGTLPKESPMVDVLARLLNFSPKEIERIRNAVPGHARRSSKGLFPFWGQ